MPAASPARGVADQPAVAIEHHDLERALAVDLLERDAASLARDLVGQRQADALGQEHLVGRRGGARMIEQVAGGAVLREQRGQSGQIDRRTAGMQIDGPRPAWRSCRTRRRA